MNIGFSLFVVFALILIAFIGAGQAGWQTLFGLWVPYGALLVFLGGVIYRVVRWAKTPVPFRIPTTCGQQNSLPWIRSGFFENPHSTWGVIGRMALEVLSFPFAFSEHQGFPAEPKAGLRQSQMALARRPDLSLVTSDHRDPAPAVSYRARSPARSTAWRPWTASSKSAFRPSI